MPTTSIVAGILMALIAPAAVAYTGNATITAFIPAFFGAVFVLLGVIGLLGAKARKHAMHGVAAFALLSVLGGLGMGLPKVIRLLGGGEVERPVAAYSQTAMGVIALVVLVMAVRSFIAARKARQSGAVPAGAV